MSQQPNNHPISNLAIFSNMVDTGIANAQEQLDGLEKAIPKPYVLDNYTVNRVIEVFKTQKDDMWLYDRQFKLWLEDDLDEKDIQEINRLREGLKKWENLVERILDIADELNKNTIEKVLEKWT